MQQKTLIALGALVVMGILAFVTLRSPEKGERTGPRERPIAAFKAADVKELSLSSNGGKDTATLKLEGGNWQVTAPVHYKADQGLVKTAVEQLEKITFGDLVTEKKDNLANLEVSDDKGAHVVAKDGAGKVLFDAWIGKSVSGFTMVRPGGPNAKDQAWQATGLYKYTYAKEAKAWRDHTIFSFNKDDVSKLTVESGGQKIALEKVPAATPDKDAKDKPPAQEARWKVAESTVKVDPMDDSVANGMVGALASLSAAEFDDATTPAAAGTENPRFKISVVTKAEPLVLLVGNTKGDDNWVQVQGKPQMFLLHKYAMDKLTQKPVDFRDKTIVRAKEEDLVGLDIANGADHISLINDKAGWKLAKGDIDVAKVKGVVTAFDDVKGSSFADTTDAAATGLGKPTGEVTLKLRDKSSVTLKIGAATKDGQEYFVQKAGSPDVLMVKKFQVDRFLKKPVDVMKAAAPK